MAPELDVASRVAGGEIIESFNFQPGVLDAVFGDDGAGAVEVRTRDHAPGRELLDSARQALERGLLEQAGTEAQRAAATGAPRIDVLLLQGEIFLRRGLSGEAVDRFNDALGEISRTDTENHDDLLRQALYGAARSLQDLGRMSEAVEAAERLCELAPGDVDALRTLGGALARVEDYARAALVLEQAREAAPDDVHLLTELGSAYAAGGNAQGAEVVLRRAIARDVMAVAARTMLARVLTDDGRAEEAETEYRAALRVLPSYGEAALGLTELLEQRGRLRDAVIVLVDLLTTDPFAIDALIRLGDLLAREGRVSVARQAYRRVLRFQPDDPRATAALADLGPEP